MTVQSFPTFTLDIQFMPFQTLEIPLPNQSPCYRHAQMSDTPNSLRADCRRFENNFERSFLQEIQVAGPAEAQYDESDGQELKSADVPIESGRHDDIRDWAPGRQEYLIFSCLSVITFVVYLDATILVTALPVSRLTDSRSG